MIKQIFNSIVGFFLFLRKTIFNLRNITAIGYFTLAIVIFASVGVYVPYVFESIKHLNHNFQDLKQNIITYYIAIFASASLDLFLKIIDNNDSAKKAQVMYLIIFCFAVGVITAYLLYRNAYESQPHVFWWLITAVAISYVMWGAAHITDDIFNPSTTLGGDTDKKLSNGR